MSPSLGKLPHVDLNHFNVLFNMMDPKEILRVYENLLFGKRAILFCPETNLLLPTIMAFNNLIFPLEMLSLHQLVDDVELLENPYANFFYGVPRRLYSEFKYELDLKDMENRHRKQE